MNKLMLKVRKYYEVALVSGNEILLNPAAFISRLAVHGLRTTVFVLVYSYVYRSAGGGEVNGIPLICAVWSLTLVQVVYQGERRLFETMKDDIVTGQIEVKLNKPYAYLLYTIVESAGLGPLKYVAFLGVSALVLGLTLGFPDMALFQLLAVPALLVLGLILCALVQEIVALAGFWIEKPDPIWWVISKLSWAISGSFVPVALLPVLVKTISDVMPFSAPFFVGRIFEMTTPAVVAKYIGIQVAWIVVLAVAADYVFRLGVKKISIHGG